MNTGEIYFKKFCLDKLENLIKIRNNRINLK
jgi:hypothetical protein